MKIASHGNVSDQPGLGSPPKVRSRAARCEMSASDLKSEIRQSQQEETACTKTIVSLPSPDNALLQASVCVCYVGLGRSDPRSLCCPCRIVVGWGQIRRLRCRGRKGETDQPLEIGQGQEKPRSSGPLIVGSCLFRPRALLAQLPAADSLLPAQQLPTLNLSCHGGGSSYPERENASNVTVTLSWI